MPKKHNQFYTSIKPRSSNPPTLESSRTGGASSSTQAPPQTVNDRIQQLRREQAPRVTAQRRDEITEVVSHRTVPPHLRRILHMAEVDAPKPKPGTRRTEGRRPPPGPAAPSSWLSGSRRAPGHTRKSKTHAGHGNGVGRFCQLARIHDDEFKVRVYLDDRKVTRSRWETAAGMSCAGRTCISHQPLALEMIEYADGRLRPYLHRDGSTQYQNLRDRPNLHSDYHLREV